MFRPFDPVVRIRDACSRREILRFGGYGLLAAGLDIEGAARGGARPAGAKPTAGAAPGRARSCIILFLFGGPSQHATWDPKPEAPAEIRGDFGAIATSVPGLSIGELLPRTAIAADKICLLRGMSTGDYAHSSSGYYMLTGRPHQPLNAENANPGSPNDFPSTAALLGRTGPDRGGLPPAVALPERIHNSGGSVWPGQDAGFLGRAHDPWLLNARLTPEGYVIREIDIPTNLDGERLGRRRALLDSLEAGLGALERDRTALLLDEQSRRAFDLLASPAARQAFRLESEPEPVRERYGMTPFGQGVLLARRLVERGVRVVQVNWPSKPNWDTHFNESAQLKSRLIPPMDQAYSALLEDLQGRRLLEETLVVCLAEFGRSPRVLAGGGRSHWGAVFSIALAGGGVRGGQIYGASDRIGAQPRDGLVRPEDLTATVFHCLGLDPRREIVDAQGRPHPLSRGEMVRAIL
jgi:hypothetical protein